MPRQYPPEFKQRALRLLQETLPEHESEFVAIRHVATKLGISSEALRKWLRQSEIDDGSRVGVSSAESAELKRLRREITELRRANEILKAASAYFAAELDRPTTR